MRFLIFSILLFGAEQMVGQTLWVEVSGAVHKPSLFGPGALEQLPNFPLTDSRSLGLNVSLQHKFVSLGTGFWFKDFGYSINQSAIPYYVIPVNAQFFLNLFRGRMGFFGEGGFELGRAITERYVYPNPNNVNDKAYNQFLHLNDIMMYKAGGGIFVKIRKFRFSAGVLFNGQLDNWDEPYGKTVGALAYSGSIGFPVANFNWFKKK